MIVLNEQHPLVRFWEEAPGEFHLDVRQLLLEGGEPYVHIMDCAGQVGLDERLHVHALFEPKPLLLQVRRMGLAASCERLEADHWVCTLERGASAIPPR